MEPGDHPFQSQAVADAFANFPDAVRPGLQRLRRLILETAADMPEVGRIEETLKWGQPAWMTPETKSGSTIRIGVPKSGGFAIYAHCQTMIIPDFRDLFPDDFRYEGNRAILFEEGEELQEGPLRLLIASALTWHLKK